MTGQPYEQDRFFMFLVISMLVVFVAQSFGLMIGAVFNVVVSIDQLSVEIKLTRDLAEWYFSGTNVISTNDDVCRFWSHFE
jgi:hypothetical protein